MTPGEEEPNDVYNKLFWKEHEGGYVMVEIVKIDEETGKSYSHHIPIPRAMPLKEVDHELYLKVMKPACNVGDFVVVEGKVYRRIRGGFRPATDDELAELLAAKLGEALEE